MGVNPLVGSSIFDTVFREQIKMASYTAELSAGLTVGLKFPPVLLLDPNGSDRIILLPAEADAKDLVFYVFNTANGAAEILQIKEDGGSNTILALDQNEFGFLYCDGTTWRGFSSFITDITATVAEMNILSGVTATSTELNYLDIGTLGTGVNLKVVIPDSGGDYEWEAGGVFKYAVLNDGTTAYTATALELNRANDVSGRMVAGGASLSLTEALHDGKTILFDDLAGTELTLPPATGSGAKFRCLVSVTATTVSHILSCVGTDFFFGSVIGIDTDSSDAPIPFAAIVGDTFDTVTWDRSTKGSAAIGDYLEVEDIVSGKWAIHGCYQVTGTPVTPFSSVVS